MLSLNDLIMAVPKLEVQVTLALFHTILWYFLINHIFVPLGILIISNLRSKKRFIHFNRESFQKMVQWDIGDDEDEQIIAIARINAAMVQHLFGGLLCVPAAFGLGNLLPFGAATAMARQGMLCEMGWEVQDIMMRCYEILFGGEKGRKLNPLNLMLAIMAHHSASCTSVIPMNITYPNSCYWHEGFCWVQLGSFTLLFLQQYGYTLDVEMPEELTKMKISISISFFTSIWTRVIRYSWILILLINMLMQDEQWILLYVGITPAILLSIFNAIVVKDAWQKFVKFVSMDIKKRSKYKIEGTLKKMGSYRDLATKSVSEVQSRIKSRKLYTGVSAEDILVGY